MNVYNSMEAYAPIATSTILNQLKDCLSRVNFVGTGYKQLPTFIVHNNELVIMGLHFMSSTTCIVRFLSVPVILFLVRTYQKLGRHCYNNFAVVVKLPLYTRLLKKK